MGLLCAGVMEDLRQKGAIEGWRDELYPVTESFNQEPLLLVERAAATYLGIKVLPKKSDVHQLEKKNCTRAYEKPFWHNGSLELFFDWCMSDFFLQ